MIFVGLACDGYSFVCVVLASKSSSSTSYDVNKLLIVLFFFIYIIQITEYY